MIPNSPHARALAHFGSGELSRYMCDGIPFSAREHSSKKTYVEAVLRKSKTREEMGTRTNGTVVCGRARTFPIDSAVTF